MSMPTDLHSAAGHPLAAYVSSWVNKVKGSFPHKRKEFQQWADQAMNFFDGAMDEVMWSDKVATSTDPQIGFLGRSSQGWKPTFRMTYNRMFEAVALFAPSMYFKNPNAQATPQIPPDISPFSLGLDQQQLNDPYMAQAIQAAIQQQQMAKQTDDQFRKDIATTYDAYLNWLQKAAGKKRESRAAICEALIKGASYLWTDLSYHSGNGAPIVLTQHVSCDDIFKDPDASHPHDVTWIARRCFHPVNVVEERYGLQPGSLKGHVQSYSQKAADKGKKKVDDASGRTHDMIEYYEIYSKNGFGQMHSSFQGRDTAFQIDVSQWGKYCKIVVVEGVPYPLNLPTDFLTSVDPYGDEAMQAVSWPWPAWQSFPTGTGWPCVEVSLYEKSKSIWPVSIFKSVAGEMKFINWVLSFLADRVASSCQTIVAVMKHAQAEMKKQLFGSNAPFSVIELSEMTGKSINEIVSFMQSPDLGTEIWNVIAAIDDKIDKRLGLTPLLYGNTPSQMRSAAEANVKEQMVSIRPDDMANSVEDALSNVLLNEAQCANYHLTGEHVMPVVGMSGAALWDRFRSEFDPDYVVHGFAFKIEGGSSRKPNKTERLSKLTEIAGAAMPVIQGFAAQGITGPYNALMTEICKASETDPTPFLVEPFQPPEAEQAGGADAAAQEKAGQEMQIRQEEHGQEMLHSEEKHEQELRQDKEKNEVAISAARQKARQSKAAGSRK